MSIGAVSTEALCPNSGLVCDYKLEFITRRDELRDGQAKTAELIEKTEKFDQTFRGKLMQTAPMSWLLERLVPPVDFQGTIKLAQLGIVSINEALQAPCPDIIDCGAAVTYVENIQRRASDFTN